ncbi:AraC family transcriptional regulator [Kribbella voronezhensis]|uniref:AraC family transcriptional regulator n=1 Tax=Kribbella voronezhensis TaxID=2512212 RepID=A0A4V3FIT8_9ACTN|nr:AraC family transcriptional regulator [Kribbella voronezhensis]TDU83733.1 AraC family transcriptional regulator [Kribbella voronezhensis]
MDAISHLLQQAQVRAVLDKRCLLAGATVMEVKAYGGTEAAFHFLLDGECTLEAGGERIALVAGDAVLLPSSPPHRIRTTGTGTPQVSIETRGAGIDLIRTDNDDAAVIDLFCGHYSFGSASGSLLLRSLPDPLVVSFGADDAVDSMTAVMRQEALADGPGTTAILSSIGTALLAMVLRRSPRDVTRAALWTAVDNPRIAAVIDAVLREPGASWPVEKLAGIASMSRATFLRHFVRQTGTTVGAFVTTVRLMTAADLLTDGDLTVASIAARVGYRSESAFTQVFSQALGTTPGRFRRDGR